MTNDAHHSPQVIDLLGVGIGPFNLSLAALADKVPGLRAAFLDQRHQFRWHPGLMISGTTVQVPFLADLVSLVDPTSRWSFLSYLQANDRLFPFYFAERQHLDRAEYEAYCRWVSRGLTHCWFGRRVESVAWDADHQRFTVGYVREDATGAAGPAGCCHARNVVLGIGTEPHLPEALRHLVADERVTALHSADYLAHRPALQAKAHVTVVGSGQSGAEIFLDLLRARPTGQEGLHWISRSAAFAPMEYSKLGLEHFTPDYTRFFHGLSEPERDRLLPRQSQLYKAISVQTIAEIYDELYRRTLTGHWPAAVLRPATEVRAATVTGGQIRLCLWHTQQHRHLTLMTDALILATGYVERPAEALLRTSGLSLRRDRSGRLMADSHYRLVVDEPVRGSVFVQNAERHTHGVGAPDLGLAAWRSAVILNAIAGRDIYRLPARTAFTAFGSAVMGPAETAEQAVAGPPGPGVTAPGRSNAD
jgi:lysine N6-hydroxylase